MVPELQDLEYEDRLKELKLPTLSYRRIRGDMIETYKILNEKYDPKVSNFLPLYSQYVENHERNRGHPLKLYKRKHRTKIRGHYFGNRIIDGWNSLPENIVSAPSLNSFERRLDKYWKNQQIVYNFRSNLDIVRRIYSSSEDEDIIT